MKREFLIVFIGIVLMFSACDLFEMEKKAVNPTNGRTTAVFNPEVEYDSLMDQDGNVYKTVTIGNQVWMAENLRTTIYNDGTPILNLIESDEWSEAKTGAYANFNNTTNLDSIATYGRLYNGYTINTNKLCPVGWHVSTTEDWDILVDYTKTYFDDALKLREAGSLHWGEAYSHMMVASPFNDSNNQSGFTAIPVGRLTGTGIDKNFSAIWWTSSQDYDDLSKQNYYHVREISTLPTVSDFGFVYRMNQGLSVRCVKD